MIVGTIAAVFAIGFVVLALVGDQIVERKAVVAGDEIDALFRLAILVSIDLRAANEAVGKAAQRAFFRAEERSDIVAETPVPFLPAIADKTADLIKPGGIPRLGN